MSEPHYKNKTAYRIITIVLQVFLFAIPTLLATYVNIFQNDANPVKQTVWNQLYLASHPRWHILVAISVTSLICFVGDWLRSWFGPEERSAETTILHQDKSISALETLNATLELMVKNAMNQKSEAEEKLVTQSRDHEARKFLQNQKSSLYEVTLAMVVADINNTMSTRSKVTSTVLKLIRRNAPEKLLKKQLLKENKFHKLIIENLILLDDILFLQARSYCGFYQYLGEELGQLSGFTTPTKEDITACFKRAHARVSDETTKASEALEASRTNPIDQKPRISEATEELK